MTKREWIKAAALGACGCVLSGRSLRADEEPAPDDPTAEAKDSDVSLCVDDIVTAYRTADWALRAQPPSPFALVTAGETLSRIVVFDGRDERVADRIAPPKHVLPTNHDFLRGEVKNLLQEALDTAKANKQDLATVRKLIDSVRSFRGGLNGPLMFTAELPSGEADVYRMKCKRGEWERITVRNTGASLLQLRAVNKGGAPRAEDVARHPYIAFAPGPKEGSDFTVTVTNGGKEKVLYQLFCN